MKDIRFFDVCCGVGNSAVKPRPGVTELLADMDRFGVERALVCHNCLNTLGAESANRELPRMLREEDPEHRLTGTLCILPSQCPELPPPDRFFASMKENFCSAITLDPFNHRYVPCRLTLGAYLDVAEKRRIPVLLNAFAGKWNDLYAFLREFPRLQCIFHGGDKWGNDRYIRPLLEAYPGARVELAGYWVPEGIADLARAYGPERILWGSGFPQYNQGSSMLQLKQSGLDEAAIALIAGKNFENMLEAAQC